MGKKIVMKIEGGSVQHITYPKVNAGLASSGKRIKGVSFFGINRNKAKTANSWIDINQAIYLKLIPKEIENKDLEINEYIKNNLKGTKIYIKVPTIKIKKEKIEKQKSDKEQQERKIVNFNKEKAKILLKKQQQNDKLKKKVA